MAVAMRPGAWSRHDPRMDPESAKRLASGFWTHEYRPAADEDVWRCDKRGLEQAICDIMRDSREAAFFTQDPVRYLDVKFGDGTGKAWGYRNRDSYNPYVDVRTPRHFAMDLARGSDMALSNYIGYATGTSTNTSTITTGSATNMYLYDQWIRQDILAGQSMTNQIKKKASETKESFSFKPNRITPKLYVGDAGLVAALQNAFNQTCRDQMRVLHG